jgi:hypothetical protein
MSISRRIKNKAQFSVKNNVEANGFLYNSRMPVGCAGRGSRRNYVWKQVVLNKTKTDLYDRNELNDITGKNSVNLSENWS